MTSAAIEELAPEVPILNSNVRVDRFVAQGGFGRVYQGHHRTLDRPVAIKVLKIPPEFGDAARSLFCERFAQEARIIARLDHPAVVRALDFGVAHLGDGEFAPYMVLDWIDGRPLSKVIPARKAEGARFDRDETLRLLTPVMEAVAMAHAMGIVHRDITPGNLMVVETAAGPALRLLDFGIAKVMDGDDAHAAEDTHTQTALLAFSPRWASPEQASRGRTGPWTDVHALGLLCSAMLTCERPYRGSKEEIFKEIFSERRPTPAAFGVDVGAWEPVLARALSLRPEDRQPDAATLLRELQDAIFASAPTRVVRVPASVRAGLVAPVAAPPPAEPHAHATLYAAAGALGALLVVALAAFLLTRRAPTASVSTRVVPVAPTQPAPSPYVAPRVASSPSPAVIQEAPSRRAAHPTRRAPPAQANAPIDTPTLVEPAPRESPPRESPPRETVAAPARPRIQPLREYP